MSDALVSPAVALVAGAISATLIGAAVKKVKSQQESLLPLMGVMGAFIFAAQMINFSIPGTGSSGHITGGVLLAAVLGPWPAFLSLTSVLIIQCLIFADGGIMALGCNIFNMAAIACLMAFPLIYRPLTEKGGFSVAVIFIASILACLTSALLGAIAVTAETELSGITALPAFRFLSFMIPIHAAIGLCEGIATAAVICAVRRYKPELVERKREAVKKSSPMSLAAIVLTAFAVAGGLSRLASSNPDGLEWSIKNMTGSDDLATNGAAHATMEKVQNRTAIMPDYNTSYAGLVGSGVIVLGAIGVSHIVRTRRKEAETNNDMTNGKQK